MRFTHLTLPALALATLLPGCIIYPGDDWDGWGDCGDRDDSSCGWDDDDWNDDDWRGDDRDDDDGWGDGSDGDGDGGGGDDGLGYRFELDPGEAEQGETFLAELSVDGDVSLEAVDTVLFTGDVEVVELIPRADRLLLVLDVADDARVGLVDAIVESPDDTWFAPDVLFIGEYGTGHTSNPCDDE